MLSCHVGNRSRPEISTAAKPWSDAARKVDRERTGFNVMEGRHELLASSDRDLSHIGVHAFAITERASHLIAFESRNYPNNAVDIERDDRMRRNAHVLSKLLTGGGPALATGGVNDEDDTGGRRPCRAAKIPVRARFLLVLEKI